MKRISIILTLSLLLISGMVMGQTWPPSSGGPNNCIFFGNFKVGGNHPVSGSKLAVLSPDLSVTYSVNSLFYNASLDLTHLPAPYLIANMPNTPTNFVLVLYQPTPTPTFYLLGTTFTSCNGNFNYAMIGSTELTDINRTFNFPTPGCPGTNLVADAQSCLLPVLFQSFTARAEEQSVRLDWATGFEENNEVFTVERSIDGESFEALADIPGAGTTNEVNHYTWIDDSPYPGISYYRIKQTDFDGAFAYSDVASVKMNGSLGQTMRLFPNPAESNVRVSIPAVGQSGIAVLRIYNHVGQLVLQEERSTEGQLMELNTSALPGGVYTVHVQQGARRYSEKLVIR